MTDEEIKIRSVYLFLACSQAVEQLTSSLIVAEGGSASIKPSMEGSLRKEFGLLFRYWTTRRIWERLDTDEAAAKALNLSLLRLFTNAFRLPRDGSGLRYAELSTAAEEVQELRRRLAGAIGASHSKLFEALDASVVPWRDAVARYTVEALESPLSQLTASVKEWAARTSGSP
jgi:hypothetical protein